MTNLIRRSDAITRASKASDNLFLWSRPGFYEGSTGRTMFISELRHALGTLLESLRKKETEVLINWASLELAIVTCLYQGLSLSPLRQEVALLPFREKNNYRKEYCVRITPCIMLRGLTTLLLRSRPDIASIESSVVLKGDEWHYERTHQGVIYRHIPADRADRSPIIMAQGALNFGGIVAGYCQATLRGGSVISSVISGGELVEKLRANSRRKQNTLWSSHPFAMVQKTIAKHAIRKTFLVDCSPASSLAITLDDLHLDGRSQEAAEALMQVRPSGELESDRLEESGSDHNETHPQSIESLMQCSK